jgi:ATP-dependent DNA helicase PIF1
MRKTFGQEQSGVQQQNHPPPVCARVCGLSSLNTGQHSVFDAIVEGGQNVFFTGNAGTGKSHLMRVVIDHLKQNHPENTVFVTASTGVAATNIGGITVHSFSGVGLGQEPVEKLLGRVFGTPRTLDRWSSCRCLLIDEVAMLDGAFLDKLDSIGRPSFYGSQPFTLMKTLFSHHVWGAFF